MSNLKDNIISAYQTTLSNLKANPTNPQSSDLRIINSTLLFLHSFLSIVLPIAIRAFTGGVGFGTSYDCQRLVDEQIRFSGVWSMGLMLANYLSNDWEQKAQRGMIRIMTIVYGMEIFSCLLALYGGGSYLYILGLILSAVLTFFHAKVSGLI